MAVASLAKAHAELGHGVVVVTPYYAGKVEKQSRPIRLLADKQTVAGIYGATYEGVSFYESTLDSGVRVLLVRSDAYFGSKVTKGLYGAPQENARFMFFCLASLAALAYADVHPDVINAHDWHAGLVPYFLKGKFKSDVRWKQTATIFTIHNLAFQFGHNWWQVPTALRDNSHQLLPRPEDAQAVERINFAKRAILKADVVNTVSETYRAEVLTKDFGQDLHRILKNREDKVFGIVNGIDFNEFNPLTDPGIARRYSDKSPERKRANKRWLEQKYGFKEADTPIICMTSRITEQKGFVLLLEIIETLLQGKVRLIIMGDGELSYIQRLRAVQKKYPQKLVVVPYVAKFETSLYAGSDMFLLPSRFEPCGINQMIAMRYGCIPVVHHIGGLADTVTNFNPITGKGNGFTFKRYESAALLVALARAIETYKYAATWKELVRRSMREANSWKIPAQKYIDLYRTAYKIKNS